MTKKPAPDVEKTTGPTKRGYMHLVPDVKKMSPQKRAEALEIHQSRIKEYANGINANLRWIQAILEVQSNAGTETSTEPITENICESGVPGRTLRSEFRKDGKFDRTAYMKDYMGKKRAQKVQNDH